MVSSVFRLFSVVGQTLVKRTMSGSVSEREGVQLPQVLDFLKTFAPFSLAESWDNVGLLVEPHTPVPIKKVLLTIDLTEAVMREAVDVNANLIIAYHPPIFQSLKRITADRWKERIVAQCLERRIAVFSPHTSWDVVAYGLTDWLASPFDFEHVEPLTSSPGVLERSEFSHQVSVLCPSSALATCQQIVTQCQGQFLSPPKFETMEKLIVFVKEKQLSNLEAGLNSQNCFYNVQKRVPISPPGCGTGRFGKLRTPITLSEAVNNLKLLIGMPQIRIALEKGKTLDSTVQSVALVAGSGASVLRGKAADLYVTGEMLHHDLLDATHNGSSVILLNHSDSERGFFSWFTPELKQHFDNQIEVIVASTDKDPIVIV